MAEEELPQKALPEPAIIKGEFLRFYFLAVRGFGVYLKPDSSRDAEASYNTIQQSVFSLYFALTSKFNNKELKELKPLRDLMDKQMGLPISLKLTKKSQFDMKIFYDAFFTLQACMERIGILKIEMLPEKPYEEEVG